MSNVRECLRPKSPYGTAAWVPLITLALAFSACGGSSKESKMGNAPGEPGWGDSNGAARSSGGQAGTGGTSSGEPGSRSGKGVLGEKQLGPKAPRKKLRASSLQHYREGAEAARRGDSSAAQRSFEKAVSADASAYPALHGLGVIADRKGNSKKALDYYQRALRVQADYAPAAQGVVAIYLRRGAVDQAVSFVAPIANRWTGALDLQVVYAEALIRAKQYEKAWDVVRRTIRQDERFQPAFVAAVHLANAQGRQELAESIVEQAFAIGDKNAHLHYLRGKLKQKEGNAQESMKSFRKAVELQPDYVEARLALGKQLLEGANYQEALTHFKAASKLSPELPAVHLFLGEAYRTLGQWSKAKASYDLVLQMGAKLPEVHFNLGLMYMTAGEKFPNLTKLTALQAARKEFATYRDTKGPRRLRDDPTEEYLRDIERQISREKRRIEREQKASTEDKNG